MNRSYAKLRYNTAKSRARQRNISFYLTFDEWDQWWLANGIDKNIKQPPKNKNTLCMCRHGDTGPYTLSNIYCATVSQNVKDQWKNGHYVKGCGGAKTKVMSTPKGIFTSRIEVIKAYGVDRTTVARWLKNKPNEFYYL